MNDLDRRPRYPEVPNPAANAAAAQAAVSEVHWSTRIAWRAGRWDPMANAPTDGTEIRVRVAGGKPLEPVKFDRNAWRERGRSIAAEEWQPIRADIDVDVEPELVWPFPIRDAEHRAWLEPKRREPRP